MDIFESFCRTCGNECLESLSIYNESAQALDKMVPISDMLAACLPASLPPLDPEDDYPKQICRICVKKLSMAFEFSHQWLGAHSEFNVALKFEQRRRRSQASKSQSQSQTQTPTHRAEPMNEQRPTEPADAVPPKIQSEKAAAPVTAEAKCSSDSRPGFKCGICHECFHTEIACKFHFKFSHKDL
ncbi:uncharacterized protein LOC6549887 [Drosophila erecta]|uniref:ZAD domain-containing protein n=1 Tax=Drosophila erecta TaxID=7220 RepID=B3NUG8_DROER|nr:uncharacterized protein LOC6549887 [Drosophila erecta]EDV46291.1 uncharacterized protein Dere_GG18292 [Drosophila erecta]